MKFKFYHYMMMFLFVDLGFLLGSMVFWKVYFSNLFGMAIVILGLVFGFIYDKFVSSNDN